ncbi:kinase-like domain-containing protein [Pilobolus umbonatus]|nr:kinase-like domain-containing protein [Pilobolus umbonatus]
MRTRPCDFHTVVVDSSQETFTVNNRYKIISKLGAGSYGSVCDAQDLHTNEVIAIKKCRHVFDRKLITKRCLREIKLLKHFNGHPRIIDIRAMDIVDPDSFNEIYLIQTRCDTTLADIIHSHLQLEPVHYRWFMYQLFSGLHYIHSANVLHRDLKPANILVNANCDIRICDFGMARGLVVPSGERQSPLMTLYVVTRWYRAPEIMLNKNSYNKAIDMWSLGCILAELYGRKVLFKGNDYVDQLHKIIAVLGLPKDTSFWNQSPEVVDYIKSLRDVNGEPPREYPVDFTSLLPGIPPAAVDLLEKLLSLNPQKRITTSEALNHPFVKDVRCPSEEIEYEVMSSQIQNYSSDQGRDTPRTRGMNNPTPHRSGSITTPLYRSEDDHHLLRRSTRVNDGSDSTDSIVMDEQPIVGEPADMDENDQNIMGSEESGISLDYNRRLLGPSGADFQALESHLSKDW